MTKSLIISLTVKQIKVYTRKLTEDLLKKNIFFSSLQVFLFIINALVLTFEATFIIKSDLNVVF